MKRIPTEYGNREERYRKALEEIQTIIYEETIPGNDFHRAWHIANEALSDPEEYCSGCNTPFVRGVTLCNCYSGHFDRRAQV